MSTSEHVTHTEAAEALDSLDDLARMDAGVDPVGPRGVLERYITQQGSLNPRAAMRATAWANAWCACAAASNCRTSDVPASWADKFLAEFDKRFPAADAAKAGAA